MRHLRPWRRWAPTTRLLQSGELYALDLLPAPHLYFGDTCRTFAVGEASSLQKRAWQAVQGALRIAEGAIKPGFPANYGGLNRSVQHHLI